LIAKTQSIQPTESSLAWQLNQYASPN